MSKPPKSLIFLALLLTVPLFHKFFIGLPTKRVTAQAPLNHLAIIMDGNRRWAKKQRNSTIFGYRAGISALNMTVTYCLEYSIKVLSVYAFSLENFQRSPEELNDFFAIQTKEAEKYLPNLIKHSVKVNFIGNRKAFPENLRETISRVEEETKQGSALQVNILFCYGGRQEILEAVQKIIGDKKGKEIDEELFKSYLWTGNTPDPDLIIRTGGYKRLSNFLPYQSTYSELYFVDKLWPDLTARDLDEAIHDYTRRKRNFGK